MSEEYSYKGNPSDVCCVCLDGTPYSNDAVIYCDGKNCSVIVHQECYGIATLPPGEHKWYCRRCEPFSTVRAAKVKCCLCPHKEGALKRTNKDEFCHVVCALWVPNVQIGNIAELEPIIIDKIPPEMFGASTCYLCMESGKFTHDIASTGICITCNHVDCERKFHASCGHKAKLLVSQSKNRKLYRGPGAVFSAYCGQHKHNANSAAASSAKPTSALQNEEGQGEPAPKKRLISQPVPQSQKVRDFQSAVTDLLKDERRRILELVCGSRGAASIFESNEENLKTQGELTKQVEKLQAEQLRLERVQTLLKKPLPGLPELQVLDDADPTLRFSDSMLKIFEPLRLGSTYAAFKESVDSLSAAMNVKT